MLCIMMLFSFYADFGYTGLYLGNWPELMQAIDFWRRIWMLGCISVFWLHFGF